MDRKYRTGSFGSLSGVFDFFWSSSDNLYHKISHGLCRLGLYLVYGMGIDTQGETRIIVGKYTADGLCVYTVLQGQRCEGMHPCGSRREGGLTEICSAPVGTQERPGHHADLPASHREDVAGRSTVVRHVLIQPLTARWNFG